MQKRERRLREDRRGGPVKCKKRGRMKGGKKRRASEVTEERGRMKGR